MGVAHKEDGEERGKWSGFRSERFELVSRGCRSGFVCKIGSFRDGESPLIQDLTMGVILQGGLID